MLRLPALYHDLDPATIHVLFMIHSPIQFGIMPRRLFVLCLEDIEFFGQRLVPFAQRQILFFQPDLGGR